MVNRLERSEAQQFRQTIGIDPTALVAALAAAAKFAHYHPFGVGLEHVVQRLRPGALFEGRVNMPTRPRINPTITFASVATVARITTVPGRRSAVLLVVNDVA